MPVEARVSGGGTVRSPRERLAGYAVPTKVAADAPRRRPTGAPPPLPRKLGATGKFWLVFAIVLATALVLLFPRGQPQVAVDFEEWILRSVTALRADWLTPSMRALSAVGTGWTATILGWG